MKAKGTVKRISIWLSCLVCVFGVSIGISNYKSNEAYAATVYYTHVMNFDVSFDGYMMSVMEVEYCCSSQSVATLDEAIAGLSECYGSSRFGVGFLGMKSTSIVGWGYYSAYVSGGFLYVDMSTLTGTAAGTTDNLLKVNSSAIYLYDAAGTTLKSSATGSSFITAFSDEMTGETTINDPAVSYSSAPSNVYTYDSLDYTSSAFTVQALNADELLYAVPGKSSLTSSIYTVHTSLSYSVSTSAGDGLYDFRAKGSSGYSDRLLVYLDTTKPAINYELDSSMTAATLTMTDEGVGVKYLYEATSSGDSLLAEYPDGYNTATYSVSSTGTGGTRSFYCVDALGQKSSAVTVTLSASVATPSLNEIYGDDGSFLGYSYTWGSALGWTCTLDGEAYTEGTLVSDCGNHTLVLSDPAGNLRYSPSFYIDHEMTETVYEPDCENAGYIENVCSRCGYKETRYTSDPLGHTSETVISHGVDPNWDAETDDERAGRDRDEDGCLFEEVCTRCGETIYSYWMPHSYVATYIDGTCAKEGGTDYVCSICGDEYFIGDGTFASHVYYLDRTDEEYKSATCEEDGVNVYVCSVCGDRYTSSASSYGHEWVLVDEYREEDRNVVRVYACSRCGEEAREDMGDIYMSTAQSLIDGIEAYMGYVWIILGACVVVWGIVLGVRYAMARRDDKEISARNSVVNFVVGVIVIALIFFCVPYLIEAVAMIV